MKPNETVVYLCAVLVYLSATTPAPAQPLTLPQCQEYAIRHSFDVKQGEWRVENDAIALRQIQQAAYPTVSGNVSEGLSLGRTIDPFSNNFVQQSIHSGNVGLGTNVVIFNGFLRQHQLRQQLFTQQADRADIDRQKRDLRMRVTAAYMQGLLSQELLVIAQTQRQTVLAQLDRTRALVREGNLSNTQLIDWEAQLATADYELLTAQTNLRQNLLSLQWLLNWQEINPVDIVPMVVPEPTTAPPADELTNLPRQVLTAQPGLQAADLRLKSAAVGRDVAKVGLYPNVSVGAGINTAYSSAAPRELFTFSRQLQYNLGQYVRLSVSIPIVNGQQARLRMATALVGQHIAETDLQKAKQQLRQDLEQASMTLTIAYQKWQSAGHQVEAQQKAALSGKARYAEGLIHAIEFATLQTNLTKARSNQTSARYEYHFRKLILEMYRR